MQHPFVKISAYVLWALSTMVAARAQAQILENVPILGEGIRRVEDFRADLHEWEQTVRGFRRDHNFALVAGVAEGTWRFERVGSIRDESLKVRTNVARFEYSFHAPIIDSFGGVLGTSVSYGYDVGSEGAARKAAFTAFPGLVAGFVFNFNPGIRGAVAVDYHLERYEGVGEEDGVGMDPNISVTLRTVDLYAAADLFLLLTWGVRLEVHDRVATYFRPGRVTGLELDSVFSRRDRWMTLGITYHLL